MEQIIPTYDGGAVNPGQDRANWSSEALRNVPGFSATRKKHNALRQIQIAECAGMWDRFLKRGTIHPFIMKEAMCPTQDFAFNELQRQAPHIFTEAMTRSDFSNLTTYALDRLMLEGYPTLPRTYDQVCRMYPNVKDLRVVERWVTDNGETPYTKVGELEGFNRAKVDTGKYTYQVYKYEKGDQISWEAVINDTDMDMFSSLPLRLNTSGIRTMEQFYLSLIAGVSGPNTAFYGTAIALPTGGTVNNKIDTSSYGTGAAYAVNPPLTAGSLILGAGLFMNLMTSEGRPVDTASDQLNVVVADGVLFQTLKMIVNTNQIASTILGGLKAAASSVPADITLMAKNWISGNINPIYAPELRNIMTSNAGTAWWMFAKPGVGRPAIELGTLTGFGSPTLYRKLPNTVRVGGGAVDEMGDFETMATEMKGLIVFGGTRMDPRMTMASNGTGS